MYDSRIYDYVLDNSIRIVAGPKCNASTEAARCHGAIDILEAMDGGPTELSVALRDVVHQSLRGKLRSMGRQNLEAQDVALVKAGKAAARWAFEKRGH